MTKECKTCRSRLFLLIMILAMFPLSIAAQVGSIKGVVRDAMGEPLAGATIVEVANPRNATITDINGEFSFRINPKDNRVRVSFVGMQSKVVTVTPDHTVTIELAEDTRMLSDIEVVTLGYGNARRRDLTGSIASVGEQTLKHIQNTNAASAITGRLAGVHVVTTQGSPDAAVNIRVRGGGSITQSNEPLYIVDGFQVSNISDIPPTDIESVDVLKDAASTAIYGAKGANGVILVTTKSGRVGKTEISFNANVGINKFYNETEVLSPYEYVYYQRELDSSPNGSIADRYGRWEDIDIYKSRQGTDWQKKLFDESGIKQNYNLNINGGSKELLFSISYTHDDEKYIMRTSEYSRDNLNAKVSKTLMKGLKLDFNVKMTNRVIDGPSVSAGWKLRDCVKFAPIGTLTDLGLDDLGDSDDLSYENISNLQDPFYNITNEYKKQRTFNNSYNASLTWDINKHFQWKAEGLYGYYFARTDNIFLANTGQANSRSGMPVAKRNNSEGINYTIRTVFSYKQDFGVHHINAMAGAEAYNSESNSMDIESDYYPVDYSVDNILAMWNNGTSEPTYTTISEPSRTQSYFSRLNYTYGDRYYFTFTLRADGTNVFSPGNKWGVFPAGAAAWRISDEPWMASTKDWLDNLKLRLSYGVVGNARVGSYWRQTYSPVTSINQLYFMNETPQSGLRPTTVLRNDDLTWESKYSSNIGLDFSLLNKRLDISIDAYNDITKNLIMSVDLPSISGYNSQYQNLGQTTNRGIELTMNANIIERKDFYLNLNFNFAMNKNKVDKLYGEDNDVMILNDGAGGFFVGYDDYRVFTGQEIGLMYGYVYDGQYSFDDFDFNNETKRWVIREGVTDCSGVLTNSGGYYGPGHIKLKDLNGDGKIDADNDRQVIGHAQPKHTGGMGINLGWKGFDLTALFNWSYGNDILNLSKIDYVSFHGSQRYQNMSSLMSLENRFSTIDPETGLNIFYGEYADPEKLQAINANKTMWNPLMNNSIITDWGVEDGSFLRLGTLVVGYTMPKNLMRPLGVSQLRFSITANNLYCWTNYSGQDPEVSTHSNSLVMGYDRSAYPRAKSVIFGLNLTF